MANVIFLHANARSPIVRVSSNDHELLELTVHVQESPRRSPDLGVERRRLDAALLEA